MQLTKTGDRLFARSRCRDDLMGKWEGNALDPKRKAAKRRDSYTRLR
jgi:hypothetical protein